MTVVENQTKHTEKLKGWQKRWDESKIGWHKEDVHDFLKKYLKDVLPASTPGNDDVSGGGARVLVPLCGKTVDLPYLAGLDNSVVSEVVGVEFAKKAVEELSSEHPDLEIKESVMKDSYMSPYTVFAGKGITVLNGDLFRLGEYSNVGLFDVVWDRASFVAIEPEMREKYAETLGNVLKPGGQILLGTLDRRAGDEAVRKQGPPYSIPETEVRRVYGDMPWVEKITFVEEVDELDDRWRQAGLTEMLGMCFIIQAKQ